MIPTMPETGIRIQPCISPHFLGGGGREEIIQHALPESRRRAAWAWWVGCHMGWQIGLAIRHGAPFSSRDEREQAALISLTRWARWGRESAPGRGRGREQELTSHYQRVEQLFLTSILFFDRTRLSAHYVYKMFLLLMVHYMTFLGIHLLNHRLCLWESINTLPTSDSSMLIEFVTIK